MTDLRRKITRAELLHALEGGAAGIFCAALFDNPKLAISDVAVENDALPPQLHALVCLMRLTSDPAMSGISAVIERLGHLPGFAKGIRLLGWSELDARLGDFLALLEPYAIDEEEWWGRFRMREEAGAFEPFERWFWDHEEELERRVEDFTRRNEAALFVVVDEIGAGGVANERLFSYGTLQQEDVQRATFGRLLDGAADALVGFRQDMLEITDASVIAKSGERFHPIVTRSGNDTDRVAGTVFTITAEELAAADAYEVADYERVEALLASGGRAWVYVKRG